MAADSSTRRVLLVLLAAFIGCPLAGCGGERLGEFRSNEGRFRILLPGKPSTQPDPQVPSMIRTVELKQRTGSYIVAWQDLDQKGTKTSPDERLDMACNKAAESLKGKTLSRKKIELDGKYPGRELILVGPDGKETHRDRLYLVEGRLYQVLVSGPSWWVESSTADRVLDSFHLLDE
jgi:hypothetical protein